jgi:hypothetical protein
MPLETNANERVKPVMSPIRRGNAKRNTEIPHGWGGWRDESVAT